MAARPHPRSCAACGKPAITRCTNCRSAATVTRVRPRQCFRIPVMFHYHLCTLATLRILRMCQYPSFVTFVTFDFNLFLQILFFKEAFKQRTNEQLRNASVKTNTSGLHWAISTFGVNAFTVSIIDSHTCQDQSYSVKNG